MGLDSTYEQVEKLSNNTFKGKGHINVAPHFPRFQSHYAPHPPGPTFPPGLKVASTVLMGWGRVVVEEMKVAFMMLELQLKLLLGQLEILSLTQRVLHWQPILRMMYQTRLTGGQPIEDAHLSPLSC